MSVEVLLSVVAGDIVVGAAPVPCDSLGDVVVVEYVPLLGTSVFVNVLVDEDGDDSVP